MNETKFAGKKPKPAQLRNHTDTDCINDPRQVVHHHQHHQRSITSLLLHNKSSESLHQRQNTGDADKVMQPPPKTQFNTYMVNSNTRANALALVNSSRQDNEVQDLKIQQCSSTSHLGLKKIISSATNAHASYKNSFIVPDKIGNHRPQCKTSMYRSLKQSIIGSEQLSMQDHNDSDYVRQADELMQNQQQAAVQTQYRPKTTCSFSQLQQPDSKQLPDDVLSQQTVTDNFEDDCSEESNNEKLMISMLQSPDKIVVSSKGNNKNAQLQTQTLMFTGASEESTRNRCAISSHQFTESIPIEPTTGEANGRRKDIQQEEGKDVGDYLLSFINKTQQQQQKQINDSQQSSPQSMLDLATSRTQLELVEQSNSELQQISYQKSSSNVNNQDVTNGLLCSFLTTNEGQLSSQMVSSKMMVSMKESKDNINNFGVNTGTMATVTPLETEDVIQTLSDDDEDEQDHQNLQFEAIMEPSSIKKHNKLEDFDYAQEQLSESNNQLKFVVKNNADGTGGTQSSAIKDWNLSTAHRSPQYGVITNGSNSDGTNTHSRVPSSISSFLQKKKLLLDEQIFNHQECMWRETTSMDQDDSVLQTQTFPTTDAKEPNKQDIFVPEAILHQNQQQYLEETPSEVQVSSFLSYTQNSNSARLEQDIFLNSQQSFDKINEIAEDDFNIELISASDLTEANNARQELYNNLNDQKQESQALRQSFLMEKWMKLEAGNMQPHEQEGITAYGSDTESEQQYQF